MTKVRVVSLASGSSGNALLIDAGHTRLLIDAGISARRISQALARVGVPVAALDAVLVTHEHVDHVRGLPVVARHGLPVYLTRGTFRRTLGADMLDCRLIGRDSTFDVGRATVTAMPVRHDASEPCGFVVEVDGAVIAAFTDLGCPEPHLRDPLRRADLIVLEANHDLDRLWKGRYPWPLKRRVASEDGHLCNDDCAYLLADAIDDARPRTVWLAHLSEENNEPGLARATVGARLDARRLTLAVLPRHTTGPVWEWSPLAASQPALAL